MGASNMHAPLQFAADKLLRSARWPGGLDGFLREHVRLGRSSQVAAADLAIQTDGVIVVDRRTVRRWMDGVS